MVFRLVLFLSILVQSSVSEHGELYNKLTNQCTNSDFVVSDCFHIHALNNGAGYWSYENNKLMSLLQDKCLSLSQNGQVLFFSECSQATEWTYTSNQQFQNGTFCLDIQDPYSTFSLNASWAWKDIRGLNLMSFQCDSSRDSQKFEIHSLYDSTRLRVFQGSPQQQEEKVQFNLNSIELFSLSYGDYKDLTISGSQIYNLSVIVNGSVVITQSMYLWSEVSYSWVFTLNTNGLYDLALLEDDISSPHTSDFDAYVRVIDVSSSKFDVTISSRATNCYRCAFKPFTTGSSLTYKNLVPDYDIEFQVSRNSVVQFTFQASFGGAGKYTLYIRDDNKATVTEDRQPNPAWLPIVVAIAIFIGIILIYKLGFYFYNNKKDVIERSLNSFKAPLLEGMPITDFQKTESVIPAKKTRLNCLDTFRGMSLGIMMFVNFGGGGYYFFNHSPWNGLTVADLVFPWFMWIMGTSMALSLKSLEKSQTTVIGAFLKATKRSIILFSLAFFFIGPIDWDNVRIFGVLQYFAISNFFVTCIVLFAPKFDLEKKSLYFTYYTRENGIKLGNLFIDIKTPDKGVFRDIVCRWPEWCAAFMFPLIYLAVQHGLSVPGCPTGYLEAGGSYGSNGEHPYCTGGAHLYVDVQFVGRPHVYNSPTCGTLYGTLGYDPEGFLGAINAVFLTFLGLQAGRIVTIFEEPKEKIIRLFTWGSIFCLIAGGLCGFSQNDGVIPVNKNFWSTSFIFVMGGSGFIVLSIFYILIDLKKIWHGIPFISVGKNSIFIYMMHEHFDAVPEPFAFNWDTHGSQLANHLFKVAFWCLVAYYLDKKRVYFTI
eukprot:c18947_g1_i1.p1 GENE.c18947_g1_i1~~c18947_g1_i1.p1  ORF type:complete len:819 (+),score=282.01 c18947_g1_i1:31-2487(+)